MCTVPCLSSTPLGSDLPLCPTSPQAFAITGNLSASLLASALPQVLLLTYVLHGPTFLLERPAPPQKGPGRDNEVLVDERRGQ